MRMSQDSEDFSVFVSRTLDTIGYNSQIIQQRRQCQKYVEHMINRNQFFNTGLTIAIVGSKREGVTSPFDSDKDVMYIFDEVICSEDNNIYNDLSNTTVFKMDFENTSPGYTLLCLDRYGGRILRNLVPDAFAEITLHTFIESALVQSNNGYKYASSDKFIELWSSFSDFGIELFRSFPLVSGLVRQTRAGPSMPTVNSFFEMDFLDDSVLSFKCQCPSIFQIYLTRKRHHGWPSQHLLQELSELDAHVVPVGEKTSPTQPLEWRICFTKAEIKLIEYLSLPQMHVYILLKIFTKDVLKKCCDAMTSYVVKNVVLWMAELVQEEKYRINTVVVRFLDCLTFLKTCLKRNYLPNYMISKRNLLNKFDHKGRYTVLSLLEECIREGSSCLLRSEKLREALVRRYTNQQLSVERGIKRDEVEIAIWSAAVRSVHLTGMCTSWPDIFQLTTSGNFSELAQLFLQWTSLEQIVEDPIAAARHFLQNVI